MKQDKSDLWNKPVLTREEASMLLGVTYPTLWKWSKNGILPYSKVGGKVFYHLSDIMEITKPPK